MGADIDFRGAAKAAARGLSEGFDQFKGAVENTYGQPGESIHVKPFDPGSVTTGAALAKLGTSIFASARSAANARAAKVKAEREGRYEEARIAEMTAQAAERTANAAKAGQAAPAKVPTPRAPVKFTRDIPKFGIKAGDELDPAEVLARRAAAPRETGAGGAAKYGAAQAERNNAVASFGPSSKDGLQVAADAEAGATSMVSMLQSPSKEVRAHARRELGLSDKFEYGAKTTDEASAAAQRWKSTYYRRKMAGLAAKAAPRVAAAEAKVVEAAGLTGAAPEDPNADGGFTPEEQALIDGALE